MGWFAERKLRKAGFETYGAPPKTSYIKKAGSGLLGAAKVVASKTGKGFSAAYQYEKKHGKGQLRKFKHGVHKTAGFFDDLNQAISETPGPYSRKRRY